tara:strand:+ start:65 stop:478 length:414 start_codon:yes stop_codon:yes gene_type:complete
MSDNYSSERNDLPDKDLPAIELSEESALIEYSIDNLPITATPMSGPSKPSQALAFGSILLGGACGGLIGFAFTDLQCSGSCSSASGLGALIGAVVGAGGVGVVSVLVLRAMNEWKAKTKIDESKNTLSDDYSESPND